MLFKQPTDVNGFLRYLAVHYLVSLGPRHLQPVGQPVLFLLHVLGYLPARAVLVNLVQTVQLHLTVYAGRFLCYVIIEKIIILMNRKSFAD